MEFLPYGKQWIDEDDIKAVVNVLTSDWLTTGPKVKEFEDSLAEKVGAKYVVAMNSGTAALHAAYFAAGLQANDEIITSPMTFAATANAALYLGAKPKFVDVSYDTGNINPELVKENISDRTKVLAPVDFSGHPVELEKIIDIAKEKNLVVVEDAAHSLGATYKGKRVGSIADMTTFSFHPVKHITTGEGGAVATNNEEYYRKLLKFRTHGISREDMIFESQGPWYHEMQTLGYNYRITDMQCALGISQLRKLDRFVERRRQIVKEYHSRLGHLSDYIELPKEIEGVESSWHLYVIKVKEGKEERKKLFEYLHRDKIGVQVHYIPAYWHPYYQQLGYQKGLCPAAEEFYSKVISLPIYPKLTLDDVKRVCASLEKYFEVDN